MIEPVKHSSTSGARNRKQLMKPVSGSAQAALNFLLLRKWQTPFHAWYEISSPSSEKPPLKLGATSTASRIATAPRLGRLYLAFPQTGRDGELRIHRQATGWHEGELLSCPPATCLRWLQGATDYGACCLHTLIRLFLSNDITRTPRRPP